MTLIVAQFDVKRVDEDDNFSFDFTNRMISSEAVSSQVWTIEVVSGTDASPASMKSGSPSEVGNICTQKLIDGVNGVEYRVICAATLDSGRVIHGVGHLLVSNKTEKG